MSVKRLLPNQRIADANGLPSREFVEIVQRIVGRLPEIVSEVEAYAETYAETYADGLALGVGQTWQDLTASRSAGTSYQNTTGRPIMVAIQASSASSAKSLEVSVDNSTWIAVGWIATGDATASVQVIVPDNHYYRAASGTPIGRWAELR